MGGGLPGATDRCILPAGRPRAAQRIPAGDSGAAKAVRRPGGDGPAGGHGDGGAGGCAPPRGDSPCRSPQRHSARATGRRRGRAGRATRQRRGAPAAQGRCRAGVGRGDGDAQKPASPGADGAGAGPRGRSSDRQPGAAATATGTDQATAGVGAHSHPKPGHTLALATGAFQGALGHNSLSVPAFLTVCHPISRGAGPLYGGGRRGDGRLRCAPRDQLGSIWISQLPSTPETGMSPGAWARALN